MWFVATIYVSDCIPIRWPSEGYIHHPNPSCTHTFIIYPDRKIPAYFCFMRFYLGSSVRDWFARENIFNYYSSQSREVKMFTCLLWIIRNVTLNCRIYKTNWCSKFRLRLYGLSIFELVSLYRIFNQDLGLKAWQTNTKTNRHLWF